MRYFSTPLFGFTWRSSTGCVRKKLFIKDPEALFLGQVETIDNVFGLCGFTFTLKKIVFKIQGQGPPMPQNMHVSSSVAGAQMHQSGAPNYLNYPASGQADSTPMTANQEGTNGGISAQSLKQMNALNHQQQGFVTHSILINMLPNYLSHVL